MYRINPAKSCAGLTNIQRVHKRNRSTTTRCMQDGNGPSESCCLKVKPTQHFSSGSCRALLRYGKRGLRSLYRGVVVCLVAYIHDWLRACCADPDQSRSLKSGNVSAAESLSCLYISLLLLHQSCYTVGASKVDGILTTRCHARCRHP